MPTLVQHSLQASLSQLVPQEWFALSECTLVLQQRFALFGHFGVVGGFGLFKGGGVKTLGPSMTGRMS